MNVERRPIRARPRDGLGRPEPRRRPATARRALTALASALLSAGCGGWPASGPGCRPLGEPVALPEGLEEASGVAVSPTRPGVYWALDDGGPPLLYAVDRAGALLDSVRLDTRKNDWEDLEASACDGGACLWVADTGDNQARRERVVVHRIREPAPSPPGRAVAVESFPIRFPNGPRDVEAIFVLPRGRLFLVSKGRHAAPTLYRYPPPLRPDSLVTVEAVQRLAEGPRSIPRQVTGASALPDGSGGGAGDTDRSLVAIRTYETLELMTFREERLQPVEDGTVSLRTLREAQGEGVALGPDGEVVLVSEAGPTGRYGSMVVLRCGGEGEGGPS